MKIVSWTVNTLTLKNNLNVVLYQEERMNNMTKRPKIEDKTKVN